MAGALVVAVGGCAIIGNLLRKPPCPLSIEVGDVKKVGHRFHVVVSIRNPTDESVAILREEEGFPDVFLTRENDGKSLESQAVGERPPFNYSNELEWSSISPRSTESVEIIFHASEGKESVFAELAWDPDLGLFESTARSVWRNLPPDFSSNRFAEWFRDFGASMLKQSEPFVPSQIVSVQEESPLRAQAASFLKRELPEEFSDAPTRISYQAIKSYAEYQLESLTKAKRVALESDAFELYERYEKGFSDEAIRYGHDLCELVECICQEVEFLHPDV